MDCQLQQGKITNFALRFWVVTVVVFRRFHGRWTNAIPMDEGDVQLCVFVQQFGLKHHIILASFTFTFWIFLRCWAFLFWDMIFFVELPGVFHPFPIFCDTLIALATKNLLQASWRHRFGLHQDLSQRYFAARRLPGRRLALPEGSSGGDWMMWRNGSSGTEKKKWPWHDTWLFFGARHDLQIFAGYPSFRCVMAITLCWQLGRGYAMGMVEHRMSGNHASSIKGSLVKQNSWCWKRIGGNIGQACLC